MTLKKKCSICLFTFVIIFAALYYFVNNYSQKLLISSLNDFSTEFNTFKYKSASIDILSKEVVINNIYISDTTDENMFKTDVEMTIKKLTIQGFNVKKYFIQDSISINKIVIDSLITDFKDFDKLIGEKFESEESKNDPNQAIVPGFKIHKVFLNNLHFIANNPKIKLNNNKDLEIIGSIIFDEAYLDINRHTKTSFRSKGIDIKISKLKKHLYKTLSNVILDSVYYNTLEGNLHLKKATLIPVVEKKIYDDYFKKRDTWANLNLNDVTVKDAAVESLIDKKIIQSSLIDIKYATINLFGSTIYNESVEPVKFPLDLIRDLKIKTKLDTIIIRNGKIKYEEWDGNEDNIGSINLDKFKLKLTNITNDTVRINKNNYINLTTSARVEKNMDFNLNVVINNKSEKYIYKANGEIGKGELSILNSLLENTADTKIDSGSIIKGKFSFNGDYNYSKGKIELEYINLKTSLSKNAHIVGFFDKLLIKTADIIIRDSNPKNKKLKTGEIYYCRPNNKGFMSLYMGSIINGVTDIVIPHQIYKKIKIHNKKELKSRDYDVSND